MAFATNTSAFGMKPATTSLFGAAQPQQQTASFANAPPLGQGQQQQPGGLFGAFGQNQPQQQNQPQSSLFGQPQQEQQQQPAGGLFGQPQQQQPSGGLFGQPQQQQPASGLFGQPQQQQQPSGNLFGQPQQQQQQPGGSLFGQPQQQQQQQPGGLFGQPQQQQPGGGLFGQPQQQQQQQPTSNLFGQPQQQQQPSGNLFGQQPQPQQQAGGGLFGQPQQQQQQPAGGLFGGSSLFGSTANTNAQQPQQQQGGGLFGSTAANPLQAQATLPAGAFGNTLFGGNKSQQPQQQQNFGGFNNLGQNQNQNLAVSVQPAGPPPFTKATKFNDLPDDVKKVLETIDSFIQGRVQVCKDIKQRKLGDEPTKGNEAIRSLHKELINTASAIRDDLHVTQDTRAKVEQSSADVVAAMNIIDGFRHPQSGNTYLKDHANFPLEHFTRVADQMKERLTWYKSTIEQIERKLASASNSAHTPQSISATLQAQHSTFLALASKTAAVDAELQKIKSLYTQLWRTKTGSVRDPFNDVVKAPETPGDFGLSSLKVR